jgi:hypothetical protein
MNSAIRARLRAAVLKVPRQQREAHLTALGCLLHLIDHCPEGQEPRAFVAGQRAYQLPALRWAAAQLDRRWIECLAPDCTEPDHVTLISAPLGGPEEVEEER